MHLKYTETQLILPGILSAVPKLLGYDLSLASLILCSAYSLFKSQITIKFASKCMLSVGICVKTHKLAQTSWYKCVLWEYLSTSYVGTAFS